MPPRRMRRPADWVNVGNPASTRLTTTGNSAPTTAEVGATMAAVRIERPRYSAARPITPEVPAAAAQARSAQDGHGSRSARAMSTRTTSPTSEVSTSTRKTLARRVARPPAKSPLPHTSAERRPYTAPRTGAKPGMATRPHMCVAFNDSRSWYAQAVAATRLGRAGRFIYEESNPLERLRQVLYRIQGGWANEWVRRAGPSLLVL